MSWESRHVLNTFIMIKSLNLCIARHLSFQPWIKFYYLSHSENLTTTHYSLRTLWNSYHFIQSCNFGIRPHLSLFLQTAKKLYAILTIIICIVPHWKEIWDRMQLHFWGTFKEKIQLNRQNKTKLYIGITYYIKLTLL